MIPLNECKHGYLYKITSRNLSYGVYNEKSQGFIGIRSKFNHLYLFTEYHWGIGAPLGTVNPQKELEPYHGTINEDNEELFKWLEIKEKEYE